MYVIAMLVPVIDPVAIQIGPINIHWYGLSYGLGLLLGWIYISSKFIHDYAADKFIGREMISNFLPWAIVGIILGGRFGYVLIYDLSYFLENLHEIYKIWNGGMSFHGGLVGIIISTLIFSKKYKLNFLSLADLLAISAPIGIFFGIISNFINHELYEIQDHFKELLNDRKLIKSNTASHYSNFISKMFTKDEDISIFFDYIYLITSCEVKTMARQGKEREVLNLLKISEIVKTYRNYFKSLNLDYTTLIVSLFYKIKNV